MSAFSQEVETKVQEVIDSAWSIRAGQTVPKTEDVVLRNGAVKVEATYLYADLANSSIAAQRLTKEATGKIIRSYLNAASRIIGHFNGHIRSFDGDRVMGIFMGGSKNTSATKAGLGINWAVHEVLRPRLNAKWNDLESLYRVDNGVGIATGEAFIVRGGVRDNNDLVSIGDAPNVAAKLSSLRIGPDVYVTEAVYDMLHESIKTSPEGRRMWERVPNQPIGGKSFAVMGSTWWWQP